MHLETKTEWRSPAYCGYTSQPSVAIASVLPLQNYTFSGVQPNLRTLSPPSSLHLILSYQLHMSTHGHKAIPVLPRFGWAKTVETPPVFCAFLPKTIETPPVSRAFLPKTIETPRYLVRFYQKQSKHPQHLVCFYQKQSKLPRYLVCFHQKRLRYTRISHVFTKNG